MEFLAKSPLGRLLGYDLVDAAFTGQTMNTTAAEKFAERLAGMTPSELKVSTQLLERHSPETLQAVRRYVLHRALQAGKDLPPSAGATGPGFSGARFIRGLIPEENLRTLYDPHVLKEIGDVVDALRRWGDRTGYNTSGTAPATEFLNYVNSLVSLSAKPLAAAGSKAIGLNQIAEAMNHPEGRAKLLFLLNKPGDRRAVRAATYLANQFPREDDGHERGRGSVAGIESDGVDVGGNATGLPNPAATDTRPTENSRGFSPAQWETALAAAARHWDNLSPRQRAGLMRKNGWTGEGGGIRSRRFAELPASMRGIWDCSNWWWRFLPSTIEWRQRLGHTRGKDTLQPF